MAVQIVCSRDLIQSNVLVNYERRAILCDFGLSKALSDVPSGLTTTRALKGSLRYLSPELLTNEKRSIRSDIWAWGCLAFEACHSLLLIRHMSDLMLQIDSDRLNSISTSQDRLRSYPENSVWYQTSFVGSTLRPTNRSRYRARLLARRTR